MKLSLEEQLVDFNRAYNDICEQHRTKNKDYKLAQYDFALSEITISKAKITEASDDLTAILQLKSAVCRAKLIASKQERPTVPLQFLRTYPKYFKLERGFESLLTILNFTYQQFSHHNLDTEVHDIGTKFQNVLTLLGRPTSPDKSLFSLLQAVQDPFQQVNEIFTKVKAIEDGLSNFKEQVNFASVTPTQQASHSNTFQQDVGREVKNGSQFFVNPDSATKLQELPPAEKTEMTSVGIKSQTIQQVLEKCKRENVFSEDHYDAIENLMAQLKETAVMQNTDMKDNVMKLLHYLLRFDAVSPEEKAQLNALKAKFKSSIKLGLAHPKIMSLDLNPYHDALRAYARENSENFLRLAISLSQGFLKGEELPKDETIGKYFEAYANGSATLQQSESVTLS